MTEQWLAWGHQDEPPENAESHKNEAEARWYMTAWSWVGKGRLYKRQNDSPWVEVENNEGRHRRGCGNIQ